MMRFITLSKGVMDDLRQCMARGNTALKECAEMLHMGNREFRGMLFRNKLDFSKLTAEQVAKINAAKPLIMDVRNKCEQRIMEGYHRMVCRLAKAASLNNFDPQSAYEEFYQSGFMALVDAVYGYTELNVSFTTYAYQCIRRRIVHEINRLNPFCPLTNQALELIRNFETTKHSFNRSANAEEVVEAMNLTPEERDVLFSSITRVISQRDRKDADEEADYTAARRNVDNDFKEIVLDRADIRQAIKDADLDEFELAVLMAEMYPSRGWQASLALKHKNPKTGKPFTRQNITFVLERAKKKVREAMENPPDTPQNNPHIDSLFEELSGNI